MEENEPNLGQYDRQIRFFGEKTQQKIEKSKIFIKQKNTTKSEENSKFNLIGAEIMKNFVLLGGKAVITNKYTFKCFKKIFPNDVERINSQIEIVILDEDDMNIETADFYIYIDEHPNLNLENDTVIVVCSTCYSYSWNELHKCSKNIPNSCSTALDCLIGSIIVQEWIKKLKSGECVKNFSLKI